MPFVLVTATAATEATAPPAPSAAPVATAAYTPGVYSPPCKRWMYAVALTLDPKSMGAVIGRCASVFDGITNRVNNIKKNPEGVTYIWYFGDVKKPFIAIWGEYSACTLAARFIRKRMDFIREQHSLEALEKQAATAAPAIPDAPAIPATPIAEEPVPEKLEETLKLLTKLSVSQKSAFTKIKSNTTYAVTNSSSSTAANSPCPDSLSPILCAAPLY